MLVTMFATGLLTAGVVAGAGPLAVLSDPTSTESTTDPGTTSTESETTTESTTTELETTTESTTTESTPVPSGPPTITPDQEDYAPGSTVTLTGANWAAGETVHIFVNDDKAKTWSYDADVSADANGAFVHQFQLPLSFAATYSVTATGPVSGTATTSFTDGNVNVKTSGVSSAGVTWSRYGNGTCAGSPTASGSITATGSGNGTGIPSGAGAGESLSLTAGSVSGFVFSSWSSGNYTTGNPTTVNPACLIGDNNTQNLTLTYTAVTDSTAPTGSISINSGAAATSSTSATLNLQATDAVGVTAYRVANGSDCSGASYVSVSSTTSYSASVPHSLTSGDGTKTVCAQYRDAAGNQSLTYTDTIVLDTVKPTITASATSPPGGATYAAGNWTNQNVQVSFTCADNVGGSGLATNTVAGQTVSTEGVTASVSNSGTCTDNAGNAANTASFGPTRIDKTKPTITASATSPPGGATYSAGTWTSQNVQVSYSCADNAGGSGLATNTVAGQTVSAEGVTASVSNTGVCTDTAGNSANAASFGPVQIDKTKPTITAAATTIPGGATYVAGTWTNEDVKVAFDCQDTGSGIDTDTVPDVTLSSEGADQSATSSGTCTDKAGNAADAATFSDVDIDKTAPVIADLGPTTSPNGNGWYDDDVVNQFKASDALSGVDSACQTAFPDPVSGGRRQDKTTSGEGAAITVTSDGCSDLAGNSTAAKTSAAFQIDKTAPVIADLGPTTSPNGNGWYDDDVVNQFKASDALSGVDSACQTAFPDPVSGGRRQDKTTSGEGAAITVTSDGCTDLAGNSTAAKTSAAFQIDKTKPSASASASPPPNGNGWNKTDVTVTFSGSDPGGSDIDFCDTPVVLSSEGAGQSASGICTDKAGNESDSATASGINIDKTAPTITDLGPTTSPNGNGWYNHNVVNQFKAEDALSGLNAACESAFPGPVSGGRSQDKTTSGEGTAITVTSDGCTDLAGNTAAPKTSDAFNVDKTAPVITDLGPTTTPNLNGWYKHDVVNRFKAEDATSGPDSDCLAAYPASGGDRIQSKTTSGEGSAITVTSDGCTDLAGNSTAAKTSDVFKIDKTKPSATASASPPPNGNGWNKTDVTVTFSGSDPGGSGIDFCDAPDVLTSEGAGQSASGTCTDKAGNESDSATAGGINIDKTAPAITDLGPTTSPNGNGWYNDDVVNRFKASDGLSGLNAGCESAFPDPVSGGRRQDKSTSGQGGAVTVMSDGCTDLAGNTAAAKTSAAFQIDKTKPNASATAAPPPNANGWNKTDVTVTYSGTDALSGIDFCDAPDVLTSEGAGQSASGTCTDKAGNESDSATAGGINIDKTAPSASATPSPAPNANGWNKTDVTVHFSGTDGLSGIDSCHADTILSSEGAGQSASGTCTDKAGNESAPATASGINIDKTAPVISDLGPTTGPNGNGWYNDDVVNQFKASDTLSGLNVACESAFPDPVSGGRRQDKTTSGEGAAVAVTSSGCTDLAGNTAATKTSDAFKIDKTKPNASASAAPAPNANGWNKTDVTVHFSGTDALSGIDSCHADTVLSGEGAGQSASGTCTDKAGNESDPATASGISIDKTNPTLTWNGGPANGSSHYYGFVPAAPTCTAVDALSGPDTCVVTGYGTSVGSHTMTATAKDKAGNVYTEQRTYMVLGWTLTGFFQPVDMNGVLNTVKNGSTVPLKFRIFAGPTELTDVANVKSLTYTQTNCDASAPQDEIETVATGGTTLRYDGSGGQFIYNWKSPSTPGKCVRVTMATQDGSSLVAFFKLK